MPTRKPDESGPENEKQVGLKPAEGEVETPVGSNDFAQKSGPPQRAGRNQIGEKLDYEVTTKSPRGVGEPAADALPEGEGGLREGAERVRSAIEAENERGYRGDVSDPTPNDNYTLKGVGAGLPTPETTVYTPRGR